MVSLKKRSEGFTIVELLIVIIIIGILSALVIVTFTGIQQKARNSERQTDLNAIASHVAAYHAETGSYPTLANLNSDTWVKDNLKGLPADALADPKNKDTKTLLGAIDTTKDQYAYSVTPTDCDGTTTPCEGYTLTARQEGKTTNFVKKSD